MSDLAPIILFVYNRPDHTRKTLEALSNAELSSQSELIVFADGPKANSTPETLAKIHETRALLREKQWCSKVTINESSENKGLAANIISGVTEVVNKYGKVIVLEDDIVIGKHFLEFMNEALSRYNDNKEVMHIAGFRPEIKTKNPNGCFFYPNMDCWGWATWADRWQYFEKNTDKLISTLTEEMIYRFNMNAAEPGNWQQVLDNKAGKINTWAIYWLASIFLKSGLCLAPCKSLCKNVGFDGSGVHCGTNEAETIHGSINHKVTVWPNLLKIDSNEYDKQIKFFRKKNKKKISIKQMIYKICPSFIWRVGKIVWARLGGHVTESEEERIERLSKTYASPILSKQEGNDAIRNLILSEEPVFISRFGSVELSALYTTFQKKKCNSRQKFELENNAGFYPATDINIKKFTDLYIENMKKIDCLGVWFLSGENKFNKKFFPNAKLTFLGALDYCLKDECLNPYTSLLAGKKVLVIHPFEATIKKQFFENREKLFRNSEILPQFELKILKAPQTLAGNQNSFKDWFEAYEETCKKIQKEDFDIALLGCGAYGLPLGGFIKTLGKKAIHVGGALQLFFGIKGSRWENREDFKVLFNEYWTSPLSEDKPNGAEKVEGACYW